MQLAHESTKIFVTGASGSGKSTYWTRLVVGYPARYKFVFDYEGELQERWKIRACSDPTSLANAAAAGWCIFDPERMFGSDLERAFDYFAGFTFEASKRLNGTKLLACDELQQFVTNTRISPVVKDVLQRGRRRGLDTAFVSHAPNELHNSLRQQFTEVVSFAHGDKCAVDWLEAWGFRGEALRALQPGQFIARRRGVLGELAGAIF